MNKAVEIFTAVPKTCNCAQSVAKAFNADVSILAELSKCGRGNAPEGLCGALYAACRICPNFTGEIKAEFEKQAGATTCREIKTVHKTPCPDCVRIAAELTEKFLTQNN